MSETIMQAVSILVASAIAGGAFKVLINMSPETSKAIITAYVAMFSGATMIAVLGLYELTTKGDANVMMHGSIVVLLGGMALQMIATRRRDCLCADCPAKKRPTECSDCDARGGDGKDTAPAAGS